MSLPDALIEQIRQTCREQGIDADAAVTAIRDCVADDVVADFGVWGGPAYTQDDLRLDVFVLTDYCIHVYSILAANTSTSCILLDAIQHVGLVGVQDERSPYVLVIRVGDGDAKRFGKATEKGMLMGFYRKLIDATVQARRLKGGA